MLIIFFLLLVGSSFFPKSRIFVIINLIYIYIAIALRSQSADMSIYYNEYINATIISPDKADYIGYNIFMRFAHNLGLTYESYVLFVATITVVLLIVGVSLLSKYNNTIAFTLACYMIYPMAHDASQIRTFLSESIVLCMLYFLLRSPNINSKSKIFTLKLTEKKNIKFVGWKKYLDYIFYLIGSYVAAQIHALTYFFIAIGLIYMIMRNKWNSKLIYVVSACLCLIIPSISFVNLIVKSLMTSGKLMMWADASTGLGKWPYIFISVSILILSKYGLSRIKNITLINKSKYLFYENINKFVDLGTLIIPLYFMDITYGRLLRIFLICLYIISGEYIFDVHEIYRNRKILKCIYIFTFILTISVLYYFENEGTIFKYLIQNNFIIDLLNGTFRDRHIYNYIR